VEEGRGTESKLLRIEGGLVECIVKWGKQAQPYVLRGAKDKICVPQEKEEKRIGIPGTSKNILKKVCTLYQKKNQEKMARPEREGVTQKRTN